ncbi:MAG: UDP-2,4-diacetamido-2,4,6-trideoxy-beta-L-altropyranose hydrolase [Legionella sp.]|nr:UDP-2,4-diacetamido-2,4,6-trideoxy-beta-L-altropyranose hydrolase [Legionella sp.]
MDQLVKHTLRIVFRVDSSLDIGAGHLMRCLALANAMKNEGWDCLFICRNLAGNLSGLIQQQGFSVTFLDSLQNDLFLTEENPSLYSKWLSCSWQTDAEQTIAVLKECAPDLLVVDHYALNDEWENQVRPHYKKLMVIDDLANRKHSCEVLLDQTLGRTVSDYVPFLSSSAQVLAGAHYALLRPEFAQLREYSLARRAQFPLEKVIITLGGVDQFNATGKILDALLLSNLPKSCTVTVIMGEKAPFLNEIRNQIINLPWLTELKVDVDNMATLMAESDLAIGAGGGSSWERCCLGLPTLLAVLAENQMDNANALERNEAAVCLGNPFAADFINDLVVIINKIIDDRTILKLLSHSCRQITKGDGLSLVLNKINQLLSQ